MLIITTISLFLIPVLFVLWATYPEWKKKGSEVNTHRNAAPINAETARELMDEREMLRAKVERLTAELAASKQENGNLFDRLRMMAQEVTGRDGDIERLTKELAAER